MKNLSIVLFLVFCHCTAIAQVLTLPKTETAERGDWICFRSNLYLDDMPQSVEWQIAADSKYWLWVNGELQVREGALKRGPNPHDTYCDVINADLGLRAGENTIAVLVWYFGKDGFSHRSTETPGLMLRLTVDGKVLSNDKDWKVCKHPAFYVPDGDKPNYRLPESNIGFNASNDVPFHLPSFDDGHWKKTQLKTLKKADWNNLVERPIPQWKDYGLKSYQHIERKGGTIYAYLPYNAQISPYMKLNASSGTKIDIRTDNYIGGSEKNVFAEYLTSDGVQEFECLGWMNGHYVIYTIPEECEVLDLKYRETGYDTNFTGSFWCDDPALTSLWNKSQRTLYITMRDTYMDCPDRERAQWWGDVVNELGEAFYALDDRAHLLTRKAIHELMDWQRADSTIFSPIPAGNFNDELPMQMLASIGYYGFWTYYMGTGDRETIEYVFPKVKKYINVWKMDTDGFVIPRKGGWTWGDWGHNKDMELLFNLWYLIALEGYQEMAQLLGYDGEARWAADIRSSLPAKFHERYWNGQYYISPEYTGKPDDRAQALAIVAGVLPEALYPTIRPFFKEQFHASPYMEKYVLQALCKMGYYQDAMDRMKLRYKPMIESPLTTLWEGWGIGREGYGGGSYNHAWSGGPLTIMSSYVAGITTLAPKFETFSVCPNMGNLHHVKCVVPLFDNRFIKVDIVKLPKEMTMTLEVPTATNAILTLPDGYTLIRLNGEEVIDGTSLSEGTWEILYQ